METNQPQSSPSETSPSTPTNHKPKLLGLLLGILVLAILGGIIYTAAKPDQTPTAPNKTSSTAKATPAKITIDATGFTPSTLTVAKGTTVNWSNQDVAKHQVVIDSYSGKENFSDFKTSEPIDKTGIYGITLYKVGTYTYHDQLDASQKGTIVVK